VSHDRADLIEHENKKGREGDAAVEIVCGAETES
jgi:hypothetical protein